MLAKVKPVSPIAPGYKTIKLSHSIECIVDAGLYHYLNKFVWYAKKSSSRLYAVRKKRNNGKERLIRMHRLIANTPKHLVCHHKNGNSLDNRTSNLQNMQRGEHDIVHWKGVTKWHSANVQTAL